MAACAPAHKRLCEAGHDSQDGTTLQGEVTCSRLTISRKQGWDLNQAVSDSSPLFIVSFPPEEQTDLNGSGHLASGHGGVRTGTPP